MLLMIGWIIFATSFTGSSWLIFFTSPLDRIRKVAKTNDGSKIFVTVMILNASFAGLFTVLLLMISDDGAAERIVFIPVVIIAMLISWAMVHTVFTVHYAHLYYGDDEKNNDAQGLEFPGEDAPDYLDFAYFSFVIGCTFQVSDVQVTVRKIRRVVLLHGLLSFVLNTFVVALTINFIAGLK
jgi:uncharacterized membrane protein